MIPDFKEFNENRGAISMERVPIDKLDKPKQTAHTRNVINSTGNNSAIPNQWAIGS